MQNLLELKGISRRVSDRFSLRDVTLAVEPGQIAGFVGANGAGKTTDHSRRARAYQARCRRGAPVWAALWRRRAR